MSGGVSATTLAAYAGLAAAAVSAGTAIMSATSARGAGQTNAAFGYQNAQTARDKAAADAQDIDVKTRKSLGSIRAGAGASGLLTDEGSPLEAILESSQNGELNRQRRLWRGEQEARADMIGAFGDQQRGDNAALAGYGTAGASLLTGASKLKDLLNPPAGPVNAVGGAGGWQGTVT